MDFSYSTFSFRIDTKYDNDMSECALDSNGDPDMSDPRAWHRLYDEYYGHEEDYNDDDDDDC